MYFVFKRNKIFGKNIGKFLKSKKIYKLTISLKKLLMIKKFYRLNISKKFQKLLDKCSKKKKNNENRIFQQ